jgi:hypothetical protein
MTLSHANEQQQSFHTWACGSLVTCQHTSRSTCTQAELCHLTLTWTLLSYWYNLEAARQVCSSNRGLQNFSDEVSCKSRSISGKGLRCILLWYWEISQNIFGSSAYGPEVEHETYLWVLEMLLALHWQSISWRRHKFHFRSINLTPDKGMPCNIEPCRLSHSLRFRGSERK